MIQAASQAKPSPARGGALSVSVYIVSFAKAPLGTDGERAPLGAPRKPNENRPRTAYIDMFIPAVLGCMIPL